VIARLAVYLAWAEADYATGQTFTLGGGLMMNQGQGLQADRRPRQRHI
jgi:hypothetical protein